MPDFTFLVPNQAPGVSVALTDNIALAGRFVNRVTDGVARGDAELAQEQHCCGGEVFAMASAGFQQESAKRGVIGAAGWGFTLPHSVSKLALEKTVQRTHRLLGILAGQFEFGDDP